MTFLSKLFFILRAICEQTLEPEYAKAAKELHKEGKVFLAKVGKCSISSFTNH
jgi:hypothetical protein